MIGSGFKPTAIVVEDYAMGRRILYLDSDPGMRKMISKVLTEEGYEVSAVSHAKEAVNELREKNIDLIITDVLLPEIDGFQFYQIVKRHPKTSAIPFVFLTSKSDEEDKLKGLKMGADDYLVKPIKPRELVAKIEMIIRRADKVKGSIEGATLAGNLQDQGVAELVQFIDLSNQTGSLNIETPKGTGKIFFERGKLYAASFGGKRGQEAVWELLGAKEGTFRFQKLHEADLGEREIFADNYAIILEGLRRFDESKANVKIENVPIEDFNIEEVIDFDKIQPEEVKEEAQKPKERAPYEFPGPDPKEDLVAYLISRPMINNFIIIGEDGAIQHNNFPEPLKIARLVSLAASCATISKSLMGTDKPAIVEIDMGTNSISVYIFGGKVVGVSPAVKNLFPPN